jgi:predicted ATPase/DNA-binding CsgD family transcriptional regulator
MTSEQIEVTSTNLPAPLTSFVGRERELAELSGLLSTSRLVTLIGPGGCGKSRLALQLSLMISSRFKDHVWLIEFAHLSDPALILQLITKNLGIPGRSEQSALESLVDHLQSKEMLIVLDNCEHLIADCAQLVQQILSQTAGPRILVTSREPLAIAGEMIYPVSGLACPPMGAGDARDHQKLMHYDAVQLFVERARAILPEFAITAANALDIVQICQRLDGLPLALELASAHTNILSLQEILTRLDDRFALLISKQRSELETRHRTLRAAIDWSYDLLSSQEQVLLQRLSVFSGGCSLAAAETVCAGDRLAREQILGLLSSLVNKSLVVSDTFLREEARYSLLQTIRQYGQEKLIDSGEGSQIRDRHLKCFLQWSDEADMKLRGEHQLQWLNWLDHEKDNIRTALAWAVEGGRLESERSGAGLRIATSLYQFWRIRDYVEEGLNWYKQLFSVANDEIPPAVQANALAYASLLAGLKGSIEDQIRYGEEAVRFGEAAGDEGKKTLAFALGAQGYATRKAGDYPTAFTLVMREIQLLREVGDEYVLGVSLSLNSYFAMSIGKYEEARAMLDEGIPLLRNAGDPFRMAMALNYAGDLARCEQNYQQAQTDYEESISLLRKINALREMASVLHNLGHACLHLGDAERAIALFSESMALHQEQGNRPGMIECLLGFAALAITNDSPAAGTRLLAAAAAIGGRNITSEWAATRLEYEQYLGQAYARLGEAAFHEEQRAGQRLPLEQAVAYAQDIAQSAGGAKQIRQQMDPLTARECEVAALIAQVKSNAEIAEELVVSKRTVESHIANIRAKLGFTERAQIVRWAIENGLVKAARDLT